VKKVNISTNPTEGRYWGEKNIRKKEEKRKEQRDSQTSLAKNHGGTLGVSKKGN